MMRFILDCLRAGRRRAACARENSVELQTREKEAAADNEIKGLEDVVAMEEGALQKERGLSRDTQQVLENLAKKRAQLKEEIEGIQEQRKQEGQLLLSLQEEQEELEQTVLEYEEELQRAKDELQLLHEDISKTKGRVEDVHSQMGLLKHSIGETYTEISEAKERLGELIAEMIAIEACVPEITCHQVGEPLSIDLDTSSREDDEDTEDCYDHVYEDDNTVTLEKVHYDEEQSIEVIEKMQRSAENLKSSGSSSFTEITLTEVKEENASPRSNTPQHMDSPDLEEDYEIVQSLDTKPISHTTSREFDFFHPDPFVDQDVFGDDRFPKVDMTEFLSGDPFKGTDPFASDILFNAATEDHFSQDYPLTEESNAKESDPLYSGPDAGTSNDAHISASANYNQSIDSGMFEQNVPDPSDSERYTPYSDICPDVEVNITASLDHVSMDVDNTIRTESDLAASTQLHEEGRFDPIHHEMNDIHESVSSDSSTIDSSFDGDFATFPGIEHPDVEMEADVGPSYVRRNQALRGLQRIDTSSYTSFPLSPEDYVPQPVVPDQEKSITVTDSFPLSSVSELKPEIEDAENVSPPIQPGNPRLLCQEVSDACDFSHADHASHSPEANDTDAYDHKFGDIYFFTVRLDPGSPDTSPVSTEVNDRKKSECDHTSPESNEAYEFDCGCREDGDPNQCSLEAYAEGNFDKDECAFGTEQPLSPETVHPESDLNSPEQDFPCPAHDEPVQCDSEWSSTEDFPSPGLHDPFQSDAYMRSPEEDFPCPEHDESLQSESATRHPIEDFPCPEHNDPVQSETYLRNPKDNIPCPGHDEPIQCETYMRSPVEDLPRPEPEDQNAGLDLFDHSVFNLESINALKNIPENTDNVVPACTADTNTEPAIQYLISPVSATTGSISAEGQKLCTHNPFSFESGSIEQCDNFESNPEPSNSENCSLKESGRCDAQQTALDLVPSDDETYTYEVKHPNSVNSVSVDGGRLDSGYHENSGLDPFSTAHTDALLSTDMRPSPGILDLEAPDPFSPESNDTMIFDSELCNPSTNDGVMKDSCHIYTAQSDILGDSFSGSELDSFDPFSPAPHMAGGSYINSNIDILGPGSIQNRSDGETRSSSCDSGVSYSPQLHCGSAANREDCPPFVNPEAHDFNYLPNCSTKEQFFEPASSTFADAGPFKSSDEKITERDENSTVSVTAMAELAEIDFFCSELSKMVASRSSDTVQQSVAEMLFGSNPDTARFYPWDFENSNMESLSPEMEIDNSNKFSKDLPKLEAGARSHRSSDLLGELAGHTLDEDEKPSLL